VGRNGEEDSEDSGAEGLERESEREEEGKKRGTSEADGAFADHFATDACGCVQPKELAAEQRASMGADRRAGKCSGDECTILEQPQKAHRQEHAVWGRNGGPPRA